MNNLVHLPKVCRFGPQGRYKDESIKVPRRDLIESVNRILANNIQYIRQQPGVDPQALAEKDRKVADERELAASYIQFLKNSTGALKELSEVRAQIAVEKKNRCGV